MNQLLKAMPYLTIPLKLLNIPVIKFAFFLKLNFKFLKKKLPLRSTSYKQILQI
jgi:hypothetical protein